MRDTGTRVNEWMNLTVVDPSGSKVGTVTDVYVDDQTDQPDWLAVSTGLFGTKVSFVPIDGAQIVDGDVRVGYEKDVIKDAPRIESDGALSVDEEQALYTYYGRGYTPSAEVDRPSEAISSDTRGRDASVLRSEEEVSIDKHRKEAGRVKLRKWVETENVQVTVPVERQKARVVRESVTDGDAAGAEAFVDSEEEVVLSEEVVDVSKRTVAKERVRLETDTVRDEVAVDETVRKERVEVDGDVTDDRRRTSGNS